MTMERYFEIGGSIVRLTAPDGDVDLAGGILEPFSLGEAAWDYSLDIRLLEDFPPPQGNRVFDSPERQVFALDDGFISYVGPSPEGAYLRMERRGNTGLAQAKRSSFQGPVRSKTVLCAMEAEHLVVEGDGFLLHSSFIAFQGGAILFTAPSGTGKSTQAELWRNLRGAEVINGDRAVVRKADRGFEALGIPFSGSSGICRPARLPLRAIVCLSQAPTTQITPLAGVRAFRKIWEGCSLHTWNSPDVAHCAQTVSEAVAQIPVYHLACTPDETAVQALEQELRKQRSI